MAATSSSLPITSGGLSFCGARSSLSNHYSAKVLKWGFRRDEDTKLVTHRSKGQAFRVLANPNVCITKGFNMYNADLFGLNIFTDIFRTRVEVPCSGPKEVSPSKGRSKKEVIMVDPLEAKRLAAKQMEAIKAREKLKRRRQIEAINGAWAMIGLTAGLVIEGQTGNSILSQLVGYWEAIVHFFVR
ncbi:hypothetical protein RHGRI_000096 [Rhododendron griersonianum]|uniref:Uncharacterized protein n=1 Tax=Rhododendron griersonianum TaxID=479676 RepID=A0AAV6LFN7_9ERIC|nr:hypothetical protein RHGRI_000096 [Rhododendron griersonianum]